MINPLCSLCLRASVVSFGRISRLRRAQRCVSNGEIMKKLNAVLIIVIVTLAAMFLAQRRVVQRLEAENKRLLEEQARSSGSGHDVPPQNAAISEDREREKGELLRLRGEVNGLRRALAKATNSVPIRSVASAPGAESSASPTPEGPVKVFETRAEVVLQQGETLITGGWETSPGRRTLVFASPAIIDPAGNLDPSGNQVVVRTHFIEMTDAILQSIAAQQQAGQDGLVRATFNQTRTAEVLEQLKNTAGVDILSAPSVTTLDGRQAQVAVQEARTFDGQQYSIGPSVDLIPVIAGNGAIRLTMAPKIALPNVR